MHEWLRWFVYLCLDWSTAGPVVCCGAYPRKPISRGLHLEHATISTEREPSQTNTAIKNSRHTYSQCVVCNSKASAFTLWTLVSLSRYAMATYPTMYILYWQATRDDQSQTQWSTGPGNARLSHRATCQLQYQTNASLNHDRRHCTYDSTSSLVPFTITTIIHTRKSWDYCYMF